MNIEERINEIIAERKKNLPLVQKEQSRIAKKKEEIGVTLSAIDELISHSSKIDEDDVSNLVYLKEQLQLILSDVEETSSRLEQLEGRFSRDTINIGVSGEARVGKSTTLQMFSGLSDTQIPTGSGLPVTAVRSEIYNSADSYALIEFRNPQSFIDEYITPHAVNVNAVAEQPLDIRSIEDLRRVQLPAALGENVDSKASYSLRALKDAQSSIDSFSPLLTGGSKKEPLETIRKYVAYPTNDEINSGMPVNRAYLAVKSVKVFSNFPSLSGERIGLIDLPGLGEIGESVATMHTSGLEDGVDQILLIMYPTSTEGFVKSGIAQNIDQLRKIQKGISKRGDLIVAAINNDENNTKTAQTLRSDFEKQINEAQRTDRIELRDFTAISEDSVTDLFSYLLEKLVHALPTMDRDVLRYVIDNDIQGIANHYAHVLQSLTSIINKILKTIPLEDNILNDVSDELSRAIIAAYDELEEQKYAQVNTDNPLRTELEKQVTAICKSNATKISNGLFKGSKTAWQRYAKGRHDYIVFFRNESERIKAELIDSYRDVDVFYDSAIADLKQEVLSVFYGNTGRFSELIVKPDEDYTETEVIERLIGELDSLTRDEDFSHCFQFLTEIRFKFSQNVFYNIYNSLEELHNPEIDYTIGGRGYSTADRIEMVHSALYDLATRGNDRIKEEILAYNDKFNSFLFTCMTFFNDFLYRKDERRFEQNIRILIKERRDYVVPDLEVNLDRDVERAIRRIKDQVDSIGEQLPALEIPISNKPQKRESVRNAPTASAPEDHSTSEKPPTSSCAKKEKQETAEHQPKKKEEGSPEKQQITQEHTSKKPQPARKSETKNKGEEKTKTTYSGNYDQEW